MHTRCDFVLREGLAVRDRGGRALAPSGTVGVVIEQQARPRVFGTSDFGASVRQYTLYGHDISQLACGPACKDLLSNTSLQVDPPTAGTSQKNLQ